MKTTFTLKKATGEKGSKNLQQLLRILLFPFVLSILLITDGGYLLAGIYSPDVSGIKLDSIPNSSVQAVFKGALITRWDKTIGGNTFDDLSNAIPTADGGYLLAGSSSSMVSGEKSEPSKGEADYWIVKIDSLGQKQWDKTLGGEKNDGLYSLISTSDGGYLLAGTSDSPASGDKSEHSRGLYDYWVVKIDSIGNKVWDKTLGGTGRDELSCAILTQDGGYLLAGSSGSNASGDKSENKKDNLTYSSDYWIVKIDAQGNKVWDKTIGGNGSDEISSMISTPEGGFLLAGTSGSDASGDKSENSKGWEDYWVVKIDGQGDKVWDKTLGGNNTEYLKSAISTPDGGYLLAGDSWSNASGDKSENGKGINDYWVVKIDGQGNKVWDKTFGGNYDDLLNSINYSTDGGYLLAGSTESDASGDKTEENIGLSDYWAVKIDANGNKIWDKTLGGQDDEDLITIISTPDNGYLFAGHSWSNARWDKSDNKRGAGDFWIVKIKEQNVPAVTGFTLIVATNDVELRPLKNGDMLNLMDLGTGFLNIRAVVSGVIDQVDMKLQGPEKHTQTEQIFPYALFGDIEGDYEGKVLQAGKYTLTAIPYIKGEKGSALSISFHVIKDIVREDPAIEWDKTFGGNGDDELFSAITTSDGGYLLAGTSSSEASGDKSENRKGDTDFWIIKTDQNGNKIWDKTFGGSGQDILHSTISTSDGGYLLAGTSSSEASGDKSENSKGKEDYWIIKTDQKGKKIWDKTLGGGINDNLTSAIQTNDGGYLLAGDSWSDASGDKSEDRRGETDFWIVKIDDQGNKVWDKTFGGNEAESLSKIIPAQDGGFLLAGVSEPFDYFDYWIVKIDSQGHKQWDKSFGGIDNDYLYSAISTSDGGYLLAGESESVASGDKSQQPVGGCYRFACDADYWIVKIDDQGNKVWDKTLGGRGFDGCSSIISTPDGGYLLAGYSGSNAGGDKSENRKGEEDFWVVKINAAGYKQWDKTIGGSGYENGAILTLKGTYLLAGTSRSDASGNKSQDSKGGSDYWIVKLNDQITPMVSSLTLIDSQTDQEVKPLQDGDVINLNEVGHALLTIGAHTSGPIDGVEFKLKGPIWHTRNEQEFPYALFGDIKGDFAGRVLPVGKYTLTVTPKNSSTHTVSFEVTDFSEFREAADSLQLTVFPVPTSEMINILHDLKSDETQLILMDFEGHVLLQQPLQQPVEQLNLSGLRKGIYYLKVVSPQTVQVFRVVKE